MAECLRYNKKTADHGDRAYGAGPGGPLGAQTKRRGERPPHRCGRMGLVRNCFKVDWCLVMELYHADVLDKVCRPKS
jgi:hypothetical protein